MDLVIVESPTKAKTLSKFLGAGYNVKATYGHIRDLPEKKLGIDVEHDFEPQYVVVTKQKERLEDLIKTADDAKRVYLATDPDREGEAIAWHVSQLLTSNNTQSVFRAEFHEITQRAIRDALDNPRKINMQLVEAQQARRVLDRLVGYKLSPLLWRKVRRGLSAGRVQSVAVRLVAEREREIEAFKPEEYWNIEVSLKNNKAQILTVSLKEKNNEKFGVHNENEAKSTEQDLKLAEYKVEKVEKKDIKKSPSPPFTTSTLQQTVANKFGWSAKKTMQVAQMLYEEGFITYHRTDSLNIAAEALAGAGRYIKQNIGSEYALDIPRTFKTKSKNAQEAHEAIRPTDVNTHYSMISAQINKDQLKLYELIWKRFVATQMEEAKGVSVKISVNAIIAQNAKDVYGLEAKGETITFDGWMKLFSQKAKDEDEENDGEQLGTGEKKLPEIREGEKMDFVDLTSEQKFTQPPARYNDASLIKALEERGIGRPSTYAPIISTIQDRLYVEKIDKRFKPTALGMAVNDFLVTNFGEIVDYGFTAKMEDELDEVANGERQWQPVISQFYKPLGEKLDTAVKSAARVKVEVETTGDKCPQCQQGDVVIRMGRFGKFLACNRYPECQYKSNYQEKTGVTCPKCGGDVIVKKTKTRKSFFGCSNYPKCDYASWTKPNKEASEGAVKPAVTSKHS